MLSADKSHGALHADMTRKSIQELQATIACLTSGFGDQREFSTVSVERYKEPDATSDVGTTTRATMCDAMTMTTMKKRGGLSPLLA